MIAVWVLSEESPFDDPEASGGCVCGVFTTAAAALFALGTWELGVAELAQMTWSQYREDAYEAYGPHGLYILRQHVAQDEVGLRTALTGYRQQHGLPPHPYEGLSTVVLLEMLRAHDEAGDA